MAQQTTSAAQSLTKEPPKRNKSDASAPAGRTRKSTPDKQPGTRSSAPSEAKVTDGSTTQRVTKQDQLAELLLRDEGASIAQMIEVTGWLPHTVRAALTGLKKKGYAIDSDKVGDIRTYRATAPQ